MIGVGAMIGAGIFVLTGIAAGTTGPGFILAFALNGIVTLFTAMVYAELGSAIPEAGGGYLWVKEVLGKSNGFLAGWMSWFSHAVAGSLYALGFGAYLGLLLEDLKISPFGLHGPFLEKSLAVLVALIFIYINFRGTSETGLAGNIVTLGKLATIALFIGFGLWAMIKQPGVLGKFQPFFPKGFGSVFAAMGLTFIAFEGYEIIAQAGEEVQNPRRSIPRAIFWSLIIVVPIYVLVGITSVGALQVEGMPTWQFLGQHKELGLVEAARRFMPFGTLILLLGGLLSTVSALNATTFSSTRVAFAMGRDRTLPEAFSRIHPKTRTPFVALLVTGLIIILMIIAIPIEDVAAAADVMFLLLFIQVNYAVLRIRRDYGDRLRYGYLIPLFPWVPIAGILSQSFLAFYLYRLSPRGWFAAIAWIAAGVVLFYAFARRYLEEAARPRVAYEEKAGIRRGKRILVPIADPSHAGTELTVAAALADDQNADLVALNVVRVPAQLPVSAGLKYVGQSEPVLDRVRGFAERHNRRIQSIVTVAHVISQAINHVASHEEVSTVVLGWRGEIHERKIRGSVADAVLHTAPADILMVKDHGLPEKVRKVSVGVSPGLRTRLTLDTAISLAKGLDSDLRVFSLRPPEFDNGELEKWFEEIKVYCRERDIQGERLDFGIVPTRDVLGSLLVEADAADLFIVGASRDWVLRQRLFGTIPDALANRSRTTIVMVKQQESPVTSWWRRIIGRVTRRPL